MAQLSNVQRRSGKTPTTTARQDAQVEFAARSIAGLLHVLGKSDPSRSAVEQNIPVEVINRQCQQLVSKAEAGLQPAVKWRRPACNQTKCSQSKPKKVQPEKLQPEKFQQCTSAARTTIIALCDLWCL